MISWYLSLTLFDALVTCIAARQAATISAALEVHASFEPVRFQKAWHRNDKKWQKCDKDLGRECLMVFMLLYAWLTSPESEMGLVRSVPASAASSANPRKAVLHKAGRLLL